MSGPRFTLKAILGCTAVLSLPLALIAAGEVFAVFVLPIAVGFSVGYLLNGLEGAWIGVLLGVIAICVLAGAFVILFILAGR